MLLKNISEEAKREPLRLARVNEVKKSRDGRQRVVVVTYQNVSINKKGNWIGNPITVERCVTDVVLVDNALNESMLSPSSKMQLENKEKPDDQETGDIRLKTMRETEENPSDEVTNEEPGNLNDNTAAVYESIVNLEIDELESNDSSGPETTAQN